jgi:hypothetical protein
MNLLKNKEKRQMKRKILNKTLFFLGSFVLSGMSFETSAQVMPIPKEDASGLLSSTMEKINAKTAEAQEYINSSVEKYKNYVEAGLSGPAATAMSKYESVKALKENVDSKIAEGQSAVAAGTSAYNDMQNAADSVENTAESVGSTVTSGLKELQKTQTELTDRLTERQDAVTEELVEKNNALKSNISTLQEMADASDDETQKAKILAQISAAQAEVDQNEAILNDGTKMQEYLSNDKEYAELSSKLSDVAADIQSQAADALGLNTAKLTGLFGMSDADRQQEYTKVITDNFLGKDEANNATTVARVMKHRYQTLYNDTAYAMTKAINIKKDYSKTLETCQMHQQNAASVQYAQTSLNLLIQSRIDDVKILSDYTTLLIAGLRRQTAAALVNFPARYTNYDRNPAVFNLDNYKFSEDDIKTDADAATGETK